MKSYERALYVLCIVYFIHYTRFLGISGTFLLFTHEGRNKVSRSEKERERESERKM